MKILLASNGGFLIKEGYQLLGIPKKKMRIGYVTTASKRATSLDYLVRHKEEMDKLGYKYEEFDIEGKTKDEILEFFSDKNVVHVEGGNTFYLLKAIRESGFDKILKTLLGNGLSYVGSSAGAYVMCPNIETSTLRKKEHFGITDFTALNHVPFCLYVHYTDEKKNLIMEKAKTMSCPVRILRDGQGILVEDGKYSFKGEGDEVQL